MERTGVRCHAVRAPAVLLLALPALLAGCGDDEPAPEQEVRRVLTTFATAAEQRDYETICTEVLAPGLLDGLRQISLPCPVALQKSLGAVQEPRLTVGAVTVEGTRATAEVRTSAKGQAPSTDTVRLDRVGAGWRISDLTAGAAAPGPTPTPESGTPGLDEG
jgi:hypothetical protein